MSFQVKRDRSCEPQGDSQLVWIYQDDTPLRVQRPSARPIDGVGEDVTVEVVQVWRSEVPSEIVSFRDAYVLEFFIHTGSFQ